MEKKEEYIEEKTGVKEWPKHLRRHYDNNCRNESNNILSLLIPSSLVNIILEYGYSWIIGDVIDPDLLRGFNPGIDNMNDMKYFELKESAHDAFVELFGEIFPGDERGKIDNDYLMAKLKPYIFDYPIHSKDITLVRISINDSYVLQVDTETEDNFEFTFSEIINKLTTYINNLKKDAGAIFISPLLQGVLSITKMRTGTLYSKYSNSTEIYIDFGIEK